MPTLARHTARGFLVLGLLALGWAVFDLRNQDLGYFAGFLLVATATASLRVRATDGKSQLSLHFFLLLLSFTHLSLSECAVIAAAGVGLQAYLWTDPPWPSPFREEAGSSGRPSYWDLGFGLAGSVLATMCAFLSYAGGPAAEDGSRSPLLLMTAACVFFVTSTAPDSLIRSLAGQGSPLDLWSQRNIRILPYYATGGGVAGLLSLMAPHQGWMTVLLLLPVAYLTYHSYGHYIRRVEEQRRQIREVADLHFRTIEALALAIEGQDLTKRGHLRRVSMYVKQVGLKLGLPTAELRALQAAAMLHDIGKLAVPEHIITKPGRFTDAEFERMKIHPIAGAEIIDQVQFPYPVSPIVRAHHEKWDGTGYPNGLAGEQIPVGARILSAVDCLDALISDRYHRAALPFDEAIRHIRMESGRSFDPQVVEVLVESSAELEIQLRAELGSPGEHIESGDMPMVQLPLPAPKAAGGGAFLSRIAAARHEDQELFYLTRELGNSLSVEDTLAVCADRIQSLCAYDTIVIYIRRDGKLVSEYASGEESWLFSAVEIPLGKGVSGWVAENRAPMLNADPRLDLAGQERSIGTTLRSSLAVPLISTNGVSGILSLYSHKPDAFTLDDMRVLTAIASKAAPALENAIRYSQAESSATTDMLTGLPNARALFLHLDSALSRARRVRESLTVLVGDLNGFKQVNDELGHLEGNRVLGLTAASLRSQCREYDFVARMGGDEFVVVLTGHKPDAVLLKIEQLQQAVLRAGEEAGVTGLSISLGEASYPVDGSDAESLLAEADRRMYERKNGRGPEGNQIRNLRNLLGPTATVQ